jgi:HK97 family phage portal protein
MTKRSTLSRIVQRVAAIFGKTGGGLYSSFSLLSSSQRDWNREAGPRYDNSAVAAIIQYLTRQITGDPRLVVQQQRRVNSKTEWVETQHPMPGLLAQGPLTDDQTLGGVILSLVVSGNAYLVKSRNTIGRVEALLYVPHWSVRAISNQDSPFGDRRADGTNLITYYEYTSPDGLRMPFRVDDIVHFRWGVDPKMPQYGMSPLVAVLREIVTDNQAATLGAALLANAGIPGVAISPKTEVSTDLTPEQREALNEKFRRRVTGDMAGAPFIAPFPVDYTLIGFSPDKLVLGQTRALATSRICSPFGIDPMVLGLPSEQKTYSNYEEAARAAWRGACKPLLRLISDTLYNQVLIVDYPLDAALRVYWDLSEVAEEQENINQEAERLRTLFLADAITRSDLRAALGYEVDDRRDNVFYSQQRSESMTVTRATQTLLAERRKLIRVEEVRDVGA